MSGATLLLHEKFINTDSSIVEMKIWQVRQSTQYPLGVRYALYWVRDGVVIVGYDNHFPKGPHRHYGAQEFEYDFVDVESLVRDFQRDLRRRIP